jgi:glyoxylase-like metal-dependent hydrolase (beta-lactamase superfamily II)
VQIHTYTSGELGLYVNAYLVETDNGLVVVDGTLTISDSKALRARIDALAKPVLAVLLTHAHPDHVAGVTTIVGAPADTPIIALESVAQLMRATEQAKHAQWAPVFGAEWITHWTYPNQLVGDGGAVTFDGVTYRVHDFGPGGDSDANALWQIDGESAAFVGDLVFSGTHCYLADGQILRWLANLERLRGLLDDRATLYPGHGPAGSRELIDQQRDYLLAYATAVTRLLDNAATFDPAAPEALVAEMERYRPGAPLSFMIALSASAVAAELRAGRASRTSQRGSV